MKVGMVTLGCDKNTVDSERYLAQLSAYGGELTTDLGEAELIIVNTCGFIDAAKKESLDALIEAGEFKSTGVCHTVVAVGCMVQRHKGELEAALPEVDLFLGNSETDRLIEELANRGVLAGDPMLEHPGVRLYSGDLPHVRYLKVSEGCDHGCAFCAIPIMRGKHRSFAPEEVIAEAQLLELQGAREINLVAQDLAHYGRDIRDRQVRLPDLLQMLLDQTTIPWIRMLYLYATGITPALLELVAREPRIMPYIDMPIQHASDSVLQRMRRPERAHSIRANVARFRAAVPRLAIRTTCIVGFPGETQDDFEQLLAFLEEVQFERVGVFTYSPQEGTRAAAMEDDVPESVKQDRLERVTELQRMITTERYEARLGTPAQALVDRTDEETGLALARLPWQADDIDGITYLDAPYVPGTLVEVIPREVVDDYDFSATTVRVVSAPTADSRASVRRQLPLISTTIGSFGR
jgi:ribosomal protein S12 methylthiotransferase